jgi:RNA polymerase sigma-B factor
MSSNHERRARERQLFARYQQQGDRSARDALVSEYLPLARRLAQRYERGREPLDDLVQVASVGLLKAIDRFDHTRPTAFSSFAVPTIAGELKRHFRDKGWWVRVPRGLQELAMRVEHVAGELQSTHGRAPTPDEIAQHLGIGIEEVLDAREAAGAYRPVSLDGPRDEADADGALADTIGREDPGYDLAEDSLTVERLLSSLSNREREILRLRFVEDLTQSQIGARVGLSQMHVSRLLRQVVARLRSAADREASLVTQTCR